MSRATIKSLQEKIDMLELSAELSDGCFIMIAGMLDDMGCMHGHNSHAGTPPMMYPEWIACVVQRARQDIVETKP